MRKKKQTQNGGMWNLIIVCFTVQLKKGGVHSDTVTTPIKYQQIMQLSSYSNTILELSKYFSIQHLQFCFHVYSSHTNPQNDTMT